MSWHIVFEDVDFNSDDMTIEELGCVEKISDTPWSILNPIKEVVAAKAFLTIAMMRQGTPDDVITKRLSELKLRDFKKSFDWIPEDSTAAQQEQEAAEDLDFTAVSSTPKLSPTEPKDFLGHQKKRASKKSETSTSS